MLHKKINQETLYQPNNVMEDMGSNRHLSAKIDFAQDANFSQCLFLAAIVLTALRGCHFCSP